VAEAYSRSLVSKGHPLSEVALTQFGVTLVPTSGQRVDFGDGEVEAKLGRLGRVRKELARRTMTASVIHLDNRRPTSCIFGGPELNQLFVTSAKIGLKEAELARQPLAGNVFVVDVDVPGLPEPLFAG
jgi:hypothetical protein